MTANPPKTPHVVIVGGGFGGLYAARRPVRAPVRVTLVDRRNHHLFQPLLYQVATAGLNPSDIAAPIRSVLRKHPNTTVILAEARSVDLQGRKLVLSIEDALEIRRRVFLAYEAAERETDATRRREWLSFVIIGAGPTGVEMAGALAEISRQALAHDFRHIDPRQARIILVEGLERVLPGYPPDLSEKARQQLEKLGVAVWTGVRVSGFDAGGVRLGDERIGARTVVWAAGVAASPLAKTLGVPLDRAGRVLVGPDLTVPGHDEAFVIGDLAALEQDGRLVPGVSPAAMQEARHTAENILRTLRGERRTPFRYVDKGSFATIGRGAAVGALFGRLKLWGFIAWVAWLGIHIFFLIGFRNRLLVMLSWGYSYLTFRRGACLITGPTPEPLIGPPPGSAT